MNNTETIKIQGDYEITVTPPDVENEIQFDLMSDADGITVFITKEQAQQLIDTLQAFIS